jgi:hypothetical protein
MSIEKGKMDGEKTRCECPECQRSTKHTILASVAHSGFVDGPDIHFRDEYAIVQCDGCETICFQKESSNSDDLDHDGQPEISTKRYPEPSPEPHEGAAYITDEVYSMPGIVQSIYSETLAAIRHGLPILAGIGIRAIVEATCHDQKASGHTLEKKIDDLVTRSFLTQTGADILHGLRLIGNNAAHEIKPPNQAQVAAAMKVIDHLLIGAYVIPKEAKVLPVPAKKGGSTSTTTANNPSSPKTSKKAKPPASKGGET